MQTDPPASAAEDGDGDGDGNEAALPLPSLLTQNMKSARKTVVVRREDGFEKRRVLRCGRCGVCVGYEILGDTSEGKEDGGRVIYLLEGGLVETGAMGEGAG